MNLHDVLARLYRSEINCSISTMWDGGWDVALGDRMNGWRATTTIDCPCDDPTRATTVEEVSRGLEAVAAWLDEQARLHFPDSDYARGA